MAAAAEDEFAGARLKITEIFHSIQGEAAFSGWPTVFVRLTGCPLRCQYCDTAYAFTGGEWRTFDEIEAEIRRFGNAVRLRDRRRTARAAALPAAPRGALRRGLRRVARDERSDRHRARRHARRARRRREDAGLARGAPQSARQSRAADAARRAEVRDLRSCGLRVVACAACRSLSGRRAVHGVFLAEPRRARGRRACRLDPRGPASRCGCKSSCTRCSGATPVAARKWGHSAFLSADVCSPASRCAEMQNVPISRTSR